MGGSSRGWERGHRGGVWRISPPRAGLSYRGGLGWGSRGSGFLLRTDSRMRAGPWGRNRGLGGSFRASSGWVRVFPNEHGPGRGLGSLARAGEPWGLWLGFLRWPSLECTGASRAGARTQVTGFSTPAFPEEGARSLRAGHLGVPRAKSQWKNTWPSHGGASTGQSSYPGVGHWPQSGKSSGGLGALILPYVCWSHFVRSPLPGDLIIGWGVENIPFAPSGALTWKTQMDSFNKEDRARGNEVAGPS